MPSILDYPKIPLKFLHNQFITQRLKQSILNWDKTLSTSEDIHFIRNKTLRYIESMRISQGPYGRYKYSMSQNQPTLYSSTYAALTRHLYNDLKGLSKKSKDEWVNYIQSHQRQDGLFKDPLIKNSDASKSNSWGWNHLTLHAVMALSALDSKPKNQFKFLNHFKKKKFVLNWIKNLDWVGDTSEVSNEVQNFVALLQYSRDFQGVAWAAEPIDVILSWLERNQNPETGLWYALSDTPYNFSLGIQTAYHLLTLFFYENRNISHTEKIIENILKTQNSIGGFGVSPNSSACEDIDSIDPLVRFYSEKIIPKIEMRKSLEKALPWILSNMNIDGGFVFKRYKPFKYGHEKMSSENNGSAMFPTWFRTLSLSYLGQILKDSNIGKYKWQYINCPGYQFWRP